VGATPAFRWNTGRIGYLVRNPFFRKPQIAGNNIQGSTNAEIMFIMFKRGREYERGRSPPLSPELSSPTINICWYLPVPLAGEGSGVRFLPDTKCKQNQKVKEMKIKERRKPFNGNDGLIL
jgi:hypothetical protein